MVTYQFEIDDETWERWKNTVPRSKSLDARIIELIEADADEDGGSNADTTRTREREHSPQSDQESTDEAVGGAETDALREQLKEELAGSGDLLEARANEVLKMYEVLREHGTAEKGDLLDVVDVEATGYQSRDSVWSNMIKGRDTLRALPGVETPATGKTTWRYTE